jgi:hypothetical protein
VLNYQGRVQVGTTDFNGTGQFKFALVGADGTTTYWSNDGTASGQPAAAVALPVTKGLYSVLLGDTALPNMAAVPPTAFANPNVHLRVWFSDGVNGFQQFVPDQRLAAAAFALVAGNAQSAASVQSGAITSAMLANGAVTSDKLAAGAVTAAISPGSFSGSLLVEGSITADKLAPTPIPTGGTLTLIGANSTSVAANISWLQEPSKQSELSIAYSDIARRPSVILGSRKLGAWTIRRTLSTDFAWKEWVREFAGTGAAQRTVLIQFSGGPTLVMSNSFPTAYWIEASPTGFLEHMTVQPETLDIQ